MGNGYFVESRSWLGLKIQANSKVANRIRAKLHEDTAWCCYKNTSMTWYGWGDRA